MSEAPADTRPSEGAKTDAELLERFRNTKNKPRSSQTLGYEMLRVDQAAMEVEIAFVGRAEFCNPMGQIQGGFLTAMLDECMSVAGVVASGVSASISSLEIKTSYLRPAFPGTLRGVGRVVKWGRTIAFLEGELYGEDGKMVARANSTALPTPFRKREA